MLQNFTSSYLVHAGGIIKSLLLAGCGNNPSHWSIKVTATDRTFRPCCVQYNIAVNVLCVVFLMFIFFPTSVYCLV